MDFLFSAFIGKWMCNSCTIKRTANGNGNVFAVDDDKTLRMDSNSSNNHQPTITSIPVPGSAAITISGPPTIVQFQRNSQPRPGWSVLFLVH